MEAFGSPAPQTQPQNYSMAMLVWIMISDPGYLSSQSGTRSGTTRFHGLSVLAVLILASQLLSFVILNIVLIMLVNQR